MPNRFNVGDRVRVVRMPEDTMCIEVDIQDEIESGRVFTVEYAQRTSVTLEEHHRDFYWPVQAFDLVEESDSPTLQLDHNLLKNQYCIKLLEPLLGLNLYKYLIMDCDLKRCDHETFLLGGWLDSFSPRKSFELGSNRIQCGVSRPTATDPRQCEDFPFELNPNGTLNLNQKGLVFSYQQLVQQLER